MHMGSQFLLRGEPVVFHLLQGFLCLLAVGDEGKILFRQPSEGIYQLLGISEVELEVLEGGGEGGRGRGGRGEEEEKR